MSAGCCGTSTTIGNCVNACRGLPPCFWNGALAAALSRIGRGGRTSGLSEPPVEPGAGAAEHVELVVAFADRVVLPGIDDVGVLDCEAA
jgi:hypothetical protein